MMAPGPVAADRIVLGNVVTLDGAGTVGEAIAIAGDRVAMVGSRSEVLGLRRSQTAVDDFGDATVIPGFNDTHAHMDSLGMKTFRPSLSGARSIRDVLKIIGRLADDKPKGEWIVTMPLGEPPYYWNAPQTLAEGRMPTRQELDRVAPDHPVMISSPSGYWGQPPCYMALNSLALKLNGIDRTRRPRASGIEIERDGSGEPTGVIVEQNYLQLADVDLLSAVPKFSVADRIEGLRRSLPMYASQGTTSVYEGHGCAPEVIASFRALRESDELTIRSSLVVSPTWTGVADADEAMRRWLPYAAGRGLGDAMLRVSGIFVTFGGDPIINDFAQQVAESIGWGGSVRRVNTPADFEEICMLAGRHGLRVHTLASDRLSEIVPVFERIARHYPIGKRRWVIEHISRATPQDVQALKRLGVGVTLIPAHYIWKIGAKFQNLSERELDMLSPAASLAALGVPVAAATDAVPNNPLFCMWVMTTRRERITGKVMGPEGIVSNDVALRLLTVNGAWLTFEENVKGPLVPGNYADLAVLSANPLTTHGDDILGIACRATMVGGEWIFRAGS